MKQIVLASASPRRKELLSLTGLSFTVDASDIDEQIDNTIGPHNLARQLSLKKARAKAHNYKNSIIIAADTFIVYKGHIIGKPRNAQDAVRMLTMLNGKVHSVITGFTLLDTDTEKTVSRAVETRVWFRRLTRSEITAYVKTGEPMDKAGAYAIQGTGAVLVKRIEGDYANVVGLPVSEVIACLKRFGVRVF